MEHVLIHEVGHYVQYMERRRQGLTRELSRDLKEQFAEAYAARYLREREKRHPTRWS